MHFSAVAPPRGERGLKCAAKCVVKVCPCRSPSWGAWIEIHVRPSPDICRLVAPPRGERGLKLLALCCRAVPHPCRSPSWGAWIEISTVGGIAGKGLRRSPSWGAWIEIHSARERVCKMFCRSPSWGAWIEMSMPSSCVASLTVAPPRGERGLKSRYTSVCAVAKGRSPSWGAWIEINCILSGSTSCVSLPLVGSVD